VHVLRDVSLDVSAGEVVSLVGPNGAGKTSIVNCVMRSYQPTSGRITFAGHDLLAEPAHGLAALGLARTFQNVELLAGSSVMDNVLLGLHTRFRATWMEAVLNAGRSRRAERAARAEVLEVLARVGFRDDPNKRVSDLSFGRQKLVEIARCLVSRPRLMVLDEPVAGLGVRERLVVADLLADIHEHDEMAMLIVEHDVGFVRRLSDRLVALSFGRVVSTGRPDTVLADEQFKMSFVGEAG
jgi:branched-chain amino acid transport system ATP-binding protein